MYHISRKNANPHPACTVFFLKFCETTPGLSRPVPSVKGVPISERDDFPPCLREPEISAPFRRHHRFSSWTLLPHEYLKIHLNLGNDKSGEKKIFNFFTRCRGGRAFCRVHPGSTHPSKTVRLFFRARNRPANKKGCRSLVAVGLFFLPYKQKGLLLPLSEILQQPLYSVW